MKRKLKKWTGSVMLVAVASIATVSTTQAATFTITDQNSRASFDTTSQNGMYEWVVDGVNHLSQEWFWYRTGSMTSELSVDTLDILVQGTTDTNFDGDHDTFYIRYGDLNDRQVPAFTIELAFRIDGALNGTGISDIGEQITITNFSDNDLDIKFFQYNDADLNGGSTDTSINIMGSPENTARQEDTGVQVHETVVTPAPNHYEAGLFSATRDSLNDNNTTTLNDVNSVAGPGDFTWAFQWDILLDSEEAFQISKDKNIAAVPAPAAALLGVLGLALVRVTKRRPN
ncbi:MAG: hypothetical protein AABZ47_19175 [Planctomycetota bacterium]